MFQESISWRNLRRRVSKPSGASLQIEGQLFVGSTTGDSEAICMDHPRHSPPRDDTFSPATETTQTRAYSSSLCPNKADAGPMRPHQDRDL